MLCEVYSCWPFAKEQSLIRLVCRTVADSHRSRLIDAAVIIVTTGRGADVVVVGICAAGAGVTGVAAVPAVAGIAGPAALAAVTAAGSKSKEGGQ